MLDDAAVFPTHVGMFRRRNNHEHQKIVFPTHVGMFRGEMGINSISNSFPHACGDVPETTP